MATLTLFAKISQSCCKKSTQLTYQNDPQSLPVMGALRWPLVSGRGQWWNASSARCGTWPSRRCWTPRTRGRQSRRPSSGLSRPHTLQTDPNAGGIHNNMLIQVLEGMAMYGNYIHTYVGEMEKGHLSTWFCPISILLIMRKGHLIFPRCPLFRCYMYCETEK